MYERLRISLIFSKLEVIKLFCLQSYRNIGMKFPILYPADNTMTDIKLLRPYVIESVKEWQRR